MRRFVIGWDWRPDGSKRPCVLAVGTTPADAADRARARQPLPGAKYGIFELVSPQDVCGLDGGNYQMVLVVAAHHAEAIKHDKIPVRVASIGTIIF